MSAEAGPDPAAVWADAALACELLAVDPPGLGGLLLRAGPGRQRDLLQAWVKALLPAGTPLLKVPLHITEDRLLGGLSLAATLREGKVVLEQGLLAMADGGVVVLAMAERLEPLVTSQVCAALDRGELRLERDGLTASIRCRLGVLALDEGLEDEHAPAPLRERLALHLDLGPLDPRSLPEEAPEAERVARARALLPEVELPAPMLEALCEAALALGVPSLRGPLLASAVARAHAALEGRRAVAEEDAAAAARLVLGPRATRMPAPTPDEKDQEQPPPPPEEPPPPDEEQEEERALPDAPLEEVVLEAARSGIPPGLLDALALGRGPRTSRRSSGHAGELKASTDGGRPAGSRAGFPRPGERLNVVETLRAAAPWQPLRRKERGPARAGLGRRLEIRKDDFRITRFQQRMETSVIFSVDASGSAALQRLAEAKGAVEQVLADCYVRRDHVALIAFRGKAASLLLPPTRSLARVRKLLADLAGGGTTPLASGIDAALALALEARKRGKTPVLVLMTDGRGNVARDGREGGAVAGEDALASARLVRTAGIRALFLDTAPRPRPQARALAEAMGARYLPLPYLDAAGISRQVQALAEGGGA